MGLLGEFERRLERAVEGFFARVFRSGVHPVEIGKRLLRVMEDGKTAGLRKTYAPAAFRITLSTADYERLAPLEPRLVEELEVFIAEAARQRGWTLADAPRVSFVSEQRLSPGEFRVEADAPARAFETRTSSAPAREQPTRVLTGRGPTLIILGDGDHRVKTVPITGRVRLGRQADNEVVLPDPGVSRHHAEVVEQGGDFLLRDSGSTNGTTVNGMRVAEHVLSDGDRFVLGNTVIEFRRS